MANPIKSFDQFFNEAKMPWIKDVKMKKGALKKEMGKKKLSPKDLAAEEKKLKAKDKDKKKPGLQLSKKDAKTQKRVVLAKNLMKASGAMSEAKTRKAQILEAKQELVQIHQMVEKMIAQTSPKKKK